MALQAFTLALRRQPYSSIWIATLTIQMTFHNSNMTELVMDAISDARRRGHTAWNLNYERWEERLTEPVDDLRPEFSVTLALH